MLSVIIPTLNDAAGLSRTLAAVFPGMADGLVRQVIVVDGGSTDGTRVCAEAAGVEWLQTQPGRGRQMQAGAEAARHPWVLFLHPGIDLDEGWQREAAHFIATVEAPVEATLDARADQPAVASFRFAIEAAGIGPRLTEATISTWRKAFRRPFGEQGLLIQRTLYDRTGGHQNLPGREDLALLRRLRRSQRVILRSRAVIDAASYQKGGYLLRAAYDVFGNGSHLAQAPTATRLTNA